MARRQPAWYEDARTLQRLRQVEQLHLRGHPQAAIAATLGVSVRTVRRDIARCEQLWQQAAAEEVARARARTLRHLDAILAHGWAAVEAAQQAGDLRAGVAALEVLRKACADRARLLGLLREPPAAPSGGLTLADLLAWLEADPPQVPPWHDDAPSRPVPDMTVPPPPPPKPLPELPRPCGDVT